MRPVGYLGIGLIAAAAIGLAFWLSRKQGQTNPGAPGAFQAASPEAASPEIGGNPGPVPFSAARSVAAQSVAPHGSSVENVDPAASPGVTPWARQPIGGTPASIPGAGKL